MLNNGKLPANAVTVENEDGGHCRLEHVEQESISIAVAEAKVLRFSKDVDYCYSDYPFKAMVKSTLTNVAHGLARSVSFETLW